MEIDLAKLDDVCLTHGSHEDISGGMCVMEAVAYLTGDKFTDFPSCTPREVARLAQRINDGHWDSDEERTEALVPLIPLLASCERSEAASRIRAFLCADRARLWAADAIELRGFKSEADEIRSIPAIVDVSLSVAAREFIRAVRKKISASASASASAAAAADAAASASAAAAAAASAASGADASASAAADAAASASAADAGRNRRRSERIDLLIAMCQVRT